MGGRGDLRGAGVIRARRMPSEVAKRCGVAVVMTLTVSLLGGCASVPALRDPVPHSASGPEKTIAELMTQWAGLTNAAIAATGYIDGWTEDTPVAKSKPWDPAGGGVGLTPCATTTSDDASQVTAVVFHAPFDHDPHPIADKLTAYWESEGFHRNPNHRLDHRHRLDCCRNTCRAG